MIYAMAIDPQDGSIVYASGFGALGGLFRSTDRGDSWTALFTDLPVGKIIVDPRDSKHLVIFAGGLATEEYVSRDSGATWKHRGPVSARFSDLVNNMVFDPSRPQNAYATGLGGPFYSRDGGDTWVESMVYKPAFAPNPERWTLPIVDSSNPDTLYVSAVSNSLGVYRSTDAGLTWLFISAEGFTTMLAGPAGSGVLYGLGSGWPLCVSLDAGVTWTQRLLDLQIVFLNMVLDPVDHSLYLFASPGLYRSKDGGLTAEEVTDLPINPDVRALYFDPVNPGQWIALTNFGADAFVTKLSPDGGTTLFTTFLGGSREDRATAVALDKSGNILVTGTTNSRDFYGAQSDVGPGTNAYFIAVQQRRYFAIFQIRRWVEF